MISWRDRSGDPFRRARRRIGAVVVLALAVASALVDAAPAGASDTKATYYVSVGDSLAQGFQPIGGPHTNSAVAGYNQGYADQLLKLAREGGDDHLNVVKLGCGGESTATMIADSRCFYPAGSQLDQAVAFLDAHQGEIAFVTVDIGANDVFEDCNGNPACFVPQIRANLPVILETLREHAGPDVPIIGMNYYAPDVVNWFQDPAAGPAAAAAIATFNGIILTPLYAAESVPVADVATAFAVSDFTTMVDLPGFGPVPLSVYNACTLTWVCTPPPLGGDIHPNNAGYAVIAEAFAEVLGT